MIISNPHTIRQSEIKINNHLDILSGKIKSESINVGYYDDTEIKERLSRLEVDVEHIKSVDANFEIRLSRLESIDYGQFATKDEVASLNGRVTTLETVPVGLKPSQMNEIFN